MALWFSLILILIVFYTIVFVLFSKIKFCDLFIIHYSVFSWLMFPDLLGWWKWHCHTRTSVLCLSIGRKESTGFLLILFTQGINFFVYHQQYILKKKYIYIYILNVFSLSFSMCCRKEPCITVILDCCRFILPFNLHFATCLCGFIYNIHICIFYFVLFIANYFKQLHFQSYLKIKF